MRKTDLESMKFNELWELHEEIARILTARIVVEKEELERRLAQLNLGEFGNSTARTGDMGLRPRRKYPRVLPKYRNPSSPSETWSGRGKTPRWLVQALESGRKMEDFKIRVSGRREVEAP